MLRAYPGLLALTVLLCSACTPEVATPPAAEPTVTEVAVPMAPMPALDPPKPVAPTAPSSEFRGWWDRPEALVGLGLTAAEGAAMASELNKLEQAYQTLQRQLPTIRNTQMQMLQDPKVPSADIRRFNRQNLQWLLTSMADQNIAARLWVREHLSVDQQERVLKHSPEFFARRWFRTASEPR